MAAVRSGALERSDLIFGARLITGVMALRCLTDHLDGDRYFRTERPNHNLDRARNQFRRLRSWAKWRGNCRLWCPTLHEKRMIRLVAHVLDSSSAPPRGRE